MTEEIQDDVIGDLYEEDENVEEAMGPVSYTHLRAHET